MTRLLKRYAKILAIPIGLGLMLYSILVLYVAAYTGSGIDMTADTAIILGARSYKNGKYNPCLVSRVTTAANLYSNKYVTSFIASGGIDQEDQMSEAETIQKIAVEQNIPQQIIYKETASTSTYENLLNSKLIMEQQRLQTAIIVTEPFHVARTLLVAKSLNINASYKAAEDSPCWTRWKYASRYFLKEPLNIFAYILTGKIKLSAFMP